MGIELFIDGRNFGKNFGASFAVILCGGEKKKYVWERSFDCEDVTTNQACLHGLLFALHSVKKSNRSDDIMINFVNQYMHSMLEKDDEGWKRKPGKSNEGMINGIRKTISEYPNIKISNEKSKLMKRAQSFSSDAAKKKKYVDSRN